MVSPTPYSEVNELLDILRTRIQAILGSQCIGMYLYGSLTYEAFDRHSDVDFVVVTGTELLESQFLSLQDMHTEIARVDCWCATQLEGSYIPRQALLRYEPSRALFFHIDRGVDEPLKIMQLDDPALQLGWWGGWVILRSNLYDRGITLAGSAPESLLGPVSTEELRQATLANIDGWLKPLLQDPSRIDSRAYQSYIVLTLCRMQYTIKFGSLSSKPVAARWAEAELGDPWKSLIEHAWLERQEDLAEMPPEHIEKTLDFIRWTIEKIQGEGKYETHQTKLSE